MDRVIDFSPLKPHPKKWGKWERRYARAILTAYMVEPEAEGRRSRILDLLRLEVLLKLLESQERRRLSNAESRLLHYLERNAASYLPGAVRSGGGSYYRVPLYIFDLSKPRPKTREIRKKSKRPEVPGTLRLLNTVAAITRELYRLSRGQPDLPKPSARKAYKLVRHAAGGRQRHHTCDKIKKAWEAYRNVAPLASAYRDIVGDPGGFPVGRKSLMRWRQRMPQFLAYALAIQRFFQQSKQVFVDPAKMITLPKLHGLPNIELDWPPITHDEASDAGILRAAWGSKSKRKSVGK
jgi:hypothetical protein